MRTISNLEHGDSAYDTEEPPVKGQSCWLETNPLEFEQLRELAATKQPVGSATPPLKHGVVGLCVGVALGAAVGCAVGLAVGTALGDVVGVAVGAMVGDEVGANVGVVVGVTDGMAVGESVGAADGVAVGVTVGARVGASEQLLQNTRQLLATTGALQKISGPSTVSQPGGSGGSRPSCS